MSKEPIAQVSHASIGRTRVVGRTPLGLPREESIPAVRGVYQYDKDGNRCFTPTHSHRAFVKHLDDKVRPRVIRDLLENGFLEEGMCPFMPRESLDNQSPVTPPADFTERCNGQGTYSSDQALGGCDHLKAIVTARRGMAKERARLRKPPERRQQELNAVVAAVMAAMKGKATTDAPPDEDEIAKIVVAVLAQQGAAPAGNFPVPPVGQGGGAPDGKAALAAARHRKATTAGEVD